MTNARPSSATSSTTSLSSSPSRFPSRWAKAAGLVAVVFLSSGCFIHYKQSAVNPKGSVARQLNGLFWPVFWIAVAVFVLVASTVLIAIIRFRARSDDEAPRQVHRNTRLEIMWTIAPALLLAGIAIPTVKMVFDINRIPKNVMQVDVIGHRWWWEYDYKDLAHHQTVLFKTANELHLPAGQRVVLNLSSVDVIHNFWVPNLAGKVYAIPGRFNHLVMEADKPGTYYGQCSEYCGTSHANMRLRVIAQGPADFTAWESGQQTGPATPVSTDGVTGAQLFATKGCAGCHSIAGISNGMVGPNLTHFKSRSVFAGSIFENTDNNLRAWLANPPAEKPGSVMPNLNLSAAEIHNLIAYLDTLK
jgi:cytochrome c oxidase subunit 2